MCRSLVELIWDRTPITDQKAVRYQHPLNPLRTCRLILTPIRHTTSLLHQRTPCRQPAFLPLALNTLDDPLHPPMRIDISPVPPTGPGGPRRSRSYSVPAPPCHPLARSPLRSQYPAPGKDAPMITSPTTDPYQRHSRLRHPLRVPRRKHPQHTCPCDKHSGQRAPNIATSRPTPPASIINSSMPTAYTSQIN